jgi:hypothetical protein
MELKTKPTTGNNTQSNNFSLMSSPADQLMQPLNQLYLKEQQQLLANTNLSQMQQSLQQPNPSQNKSKLVELLNYQKPNNTVGGNNNHNNRGFPQQQNAFSSFNTPNIGQNWNNFNL